MVILVLSSTMKPQISAILLDDNKSSVFYQPLDERDQNNTFNHYGITFVSLEWLSLSFLDGTDENCAEKFNFIEGLWHIVS